MTVNEVIDELMTWAQRGYGNAPVYVGLQGSCPYVPLDAMMPLHLVEDTIDPLTSDYRIQKCLVLCPDADEAMAELNKPKRPKELNDKTLPPTGTA